MDKLTNIILLRRVCHQCSTNINRLAAKDGRLSKGGSVTLSWPSEEDEELDNMQKDEILPNSDMILSKSSEDEELDNKKKDERLSKSSEDENLDKIVQISDDAALSKEETNNEKPLIELLYPILDPVLKLAIIHYGELAQSCYDAFQEDRNSFYFGFCNFKRQNFFEKLKLTGKGYQVTRYIYAVMQPGGNNTIENWIGYVAVETNKPVGRRRDIVVAWRGTKTCLEWINNSRPCLTRPTSSSKDQKVKVHSGFYDIYSSKRGACQNCTFSAREQVLYEIEKLVRKYGNDQITVTTTGHSLGSALSIICALDIGELRTSVGLDSDTPIKVYSFAGPRVGNPRLSERLTKLKVRVLRVINIHDNVPTLPCWGYGHAGDVLNLNHNDSKQVGGISCGDAHNLELHLHLVDGYQNEDNRFVPTSGSRNVSLMNKSGQFSASGIEAYYSEERPKPKEDWEKPTWENRRRGTIDELEKYRENCPLEPHPSNMRKKVGEIFAGLLEKKE